MSKETSIKMVGSWSKEMNTSLQSALSYTYQISNRILAEACKHAIILMAKAASKLTRQSKKNRKMQRDKSGRYYERTTKSGVKKIYEWSFRNPEIARYFGSWEKVRAIPRRGLAKRSWMWGLKALNKPTGSKPMGHIASTRKIITRTIGGFVLTNKLGYLLKAMPPGWLQAVERSAANKIMKQAQMKLQRQWTSGVKRKHPGAKTGPDLGKYIKRVA